MVLRGLVDAGRTSVAELRALLTKLAAQLPVVPLSTARRSTGEAQVILTSTWNAIEHPSAQAAVAAAFAASERLCRHYRGPGASG